MYKFYLNQLINFFETIRFKRDIVDISIALLGFTIISHILLFYVTLKKLSYGDFGFNLSINKYWFTLPSVVIVYFFFKFFTKKRIGIIRSNNKYYPMWLNIMFIIFYTVVPLLILFYYAD